MLQLNIIQISTRR